MTDHPRLYTSLRSPYSWFAHHRLKHYGFPADELEIVPVFPPTAEVAEAMSRGRTKGAYQRADVARLAKAYGLPLSGRLADDCDWWRPHATFLWARDLGAGDAFLDRVFAKRFAEGADLGRDDVLATVAGELGLDPEAAVAAATRPDLRQRLEAGFEQMRADGSFGVPTILYRGELFWGNDRLEWFLRAWRRAHGEEVPDLSKDPLARPF